MVCFSREANSLENGLDALFVDLLFPLFLV